MGVCRQLMVMAFLCAAAPVGAHANSLADPAQSCRGRDDLRDGETTAQLIAGINRITQKLAEQAPAFQTQTCEKLNPTLDDLKGPRIQQMDWSRDESQWF